MSTPSVVVFDVNETLSDLTPMGRRFVDVGVPEWTAQIWFASLLRDGFALTAAGATEQFSTIGEWVLRSILAGQSMTRDLDAAIEHVMRGFLELRLHPDVPDGVRALAASGARLITLTNGSPEVAEGLFAAAGIRDHFEQLLSVEDASVWKPARAAYEYAARTCSVDPADMLLVAVHPWDIDGAKRAGLRTAWVDRQGRPYPAHFLAPDYSVAALPELAGVVG